MKYTRLLIFIVIAAYTLYMGFAIYDGLDQSFINQDKCLEKGLNYYRVEGGVGFLGMGVREVETNKANSDFSRYECNKWVGILSGKVRRR